MFEDRFEGGVYEMKSMPFCGESSVDSVLGLVGKLTGLDHVLTILADL